jgi:hypothetical protein
MGFWYALGLSAAAGSMVVACGGDSSGGGGYPAKDGGADASDASDASKPVDSGSDAANDAGPDSPAEASVCVSNCSSDLECQSSCPATDAGIACCDTSSGTCFNSTAVACPVAQDSGPPPY